MTESIGFIGTGAITEAMVTGLMGGDDAPSEVIVSARNGVISARLAANFSQVRVEHSNQAIVECADVVVLAIRPQVAEEVIKALSFRPGQRIISVIAATPLSLLHEWIAADVKIVQAIPLPFVAQRTGVTAIYPPDAEVAAMFNLLGRSVECDKKEDYDLLAAASALMSTYFGVLSSACSWLEKYGLPNDKAQDYLSHLFASLSGATLVSGSTSFRDLSVEYATPGGLNEQVLRDFSQHGGERALHVALDNVLGRITR
ncbi:pyrroline-5-carboxylate reductase [Pseudomonas putida]|uniref:pyrroline-5-carboxylate reductase n=1 Tax=Pseudomonas putida TaxID=303 RepID=UPI003905EDF5